MEGMLLVFNPLLQVDQLSLLPLELVVIPSEFGKIALSILFFFAFFHDRQDQWLATGLVCEVKPLQDQR